MLKVGLKSLVPRYFYSSENNVLRGTALMSALHSVEIVRAAPDRTLAVLVRFLDPKTGEPRRTLPLLLEEPTYRVNGFELDGDERVEVISEPGADIQVRLRKRGALYRMVRSAVGGVVGGRAEPQANFPAHPAPEAPGSLPSPAPLVSIIIPTRERADLLAAAVRTLFAEASYPHIELVIVDNGSVEPATAALFQQLSTDPRVRIVPSPGAFNFAALINKGTRNASGDVLAILNNDIEAQASDWLDRLTARALAEDIGAVGAKLLYPNGAIQHAGIVLGVGGLVGHSGRGLGGNAAGPDGMLMRTREVSAVTGACLVTRRSVFDALGGLDETFAVEFNDVDYCLRAGERGLKILCAANPVLIHREGSTRGHTDRPSLQVMRDQTAFMQRWASKLARDPHYPAHLSRQSEAMAKS